jgi:hypothetical protein
MSNKPYPYKDAKLLPDDHELLRQLAYLLNEPRTKILGRLLRQEMARVKENNHDHSDTGNAIADLPDRL